MKDMYVTPKAIDQDIKNISAIISSAINNLEAGWNIWIITSFERTVKLLVINTIFWLMDIFK